MQENQLEADTLSRHFWDSMVIQVGVCNLLTSLYIYLENKETQVQ